MQVSVYDHVKSANQTMDYHVITTKENLELTISNRSSHTNCSSHFLTLVDLISSYNSSSSIKNISILPENITSLRLIHLCILINIKSIENFRNIRRLYFENCTIHFLASQQHDDYDYYPKNLSHWSFNQGQTETFNEFISIVNHLDPFKFDLHLSNCFQPISSFNDFIPLAVPFIFLNITCKYFQIDEPFQSKTRSAIFLTPTLIINTQFKPCPSISKYLWLIFKRTQTKIYSLRTLTCENRLIQLNFDYNQTRLLTTKTINLLNHTEIFLTTRTSNRWTIPILMNFTVILLTSLMLFVSLTIFLIRFCNEIKQPTI